MRVRKQYIRREVEAILEKYAPGTIPVPTDKIARLLGFEVRFVDDDEEMSGFLMRRSNTVIIGVNQNHSPNRRRFTIAHEIGHAILHSSELFVDRKFRNELSSQGTDWEEREANLFAAELLMPETPLRKHVKNSILDVESDYEINNLAKIFQVSTLAMTNRLTYLGFFD